MSRTARLHPDYRSSDAYATAACHFPSACPTDTPCPKLIPVHCACGHLSQNARCGACDEKPEGNEGRLLKCTDACAVAKRNAQLAEALGVEQRETKTKEVEYPPELLAYYGANSAWAQLIEQQLVEFVKSDKPSLHLPVMKRPQREFVRPNFTRLLFMEPTFLLPPQVHNLTDYFDLRSESLDEEPRRSVVCHRTSTTGVPTPTLADALAASRKTSSANLSLGSLRKALPERPPNNALYLEMVLGYDEASLSDILRPHTRGLVFTLTWVVRQMPLFDSHAGCSDDRDPTDGRRRSRLIRSGHPGPRAQALIHLHGPSPCHRRDGLLCRRRVGRRWRRRARRSRVLDSCCRLPCRR